MSDYTICACSLEQAADELVELIRAPGGAKDPFEPLLLAAGHHAQVPWLRHQVATRMGVAAVWEVMTLRAAMDTAIRSCLAPEASDDGLWWEQGGKDDDPWAPERLRGQIVAAFRALADRPDCEDLRRYLYGNDAPDDVHWRELALAEEVAAVLNRLMRERWEQALRWARNPEEQDEDGPPWLRHLCLELGLTRDDSPCRMREQLLTEGGRKLEGTPLIIFGASALSTEEQRALDALAGLLPIRRIRVVSSPARWAGEGEDQPANPVFRDLGRAEDLERGRPRASWTPEKLPAAGDSWLGRLQASVAGDAVVEPGSWPVPDPGEVSLTFHRCHGAVRQVELLRDTLLRWFASDPDLEPRDVLVMTPDLERHAALVEWVLARRGTHKSKRRGEQNTGADKPRAVGGERPPDTRPPAIPVAVADLGLARTNPVAEALLAVLELCEERVDAPRLCTLVGLEPVRKRFQLSFDDVADLRTLLLESGARWGIDGDDRALEQQPNRHQNTVEFGLERLALGTLMPDEGLEQGIGHPDLGPLVPLPVDGAGRTSRVARLAAIARAVKAGRGRFRAAGTRTPEKWRAALFMLLDDFTETSAASSWLRVQAEEALEEALPDGDEATLDLGAVRRMVRDRFELPQRGGKVISGAVTVRQLSLDVSTPHKVVVLLGMDDGAFPCSPRPREWDPFASPGDEDHDPRDLERLAMLQAILGARERLMVCWSGHDLLKGEQLPPCVPVGELLDQVARATGRTPAQITRRHARQPWSRKDLDGAIYDASTVEAAKRVAKIQTGEAAPEQIGLAAGGDAALPPEDHPVTDMSLETLARDLVNPSKLFLYKRLGVFLEEAEGAVPDREPLELSSLDEWSVRDEAVRMLSHAGEEDEATADSLVRRFAGRGLLPLQAGGERLATKIADEVQEMKSKYAEVAGEGVSSPLYSVELPCGVTVSGAAHRLRELDDELLLEWLDAGKVGKAKRWLKAWVHLLAARAEDDRVVGARMVGAGPTELWLAAPADREEAKQVLNELVEIWQQCRVSRLPLFEICSFELAKRIFGKPEDKLGREEFRQGAAKLVHEKWYGSDFSYAELNDRWVSALFSGFDPSEDLDDLANPRERESFVALARATWLPLVAAEKGKKDLVKKWRGGGK